MMKSNESRAMSKNHFHIEDLRLDDLEAGSIKGGIDTVPLPERTSSPSRLGIVSTSTTTSKLGSVGTVMIGTWPTPESPLLSASIIRM
jgi:hypothetical protein